MSQDQKAKSGSVTARLSAEDRRRFDAIKATLSAKRDTDALIEAIRFLSDAHGFGFSASQAREVLRAFQAPAPRPIADDVFAPWPAGPAAASEPAQAATPPAAKLPAPTAAGEPAKAVLSPEERERQRIEDLERARAARLIGRAR